MQKILNRKNINHILIFLAITATILRLMLTNGLLILFAAGSQYDDIMQVLKAFTIGAGYWLGEYGPMTLVKGVGYPLITAIFHFFNIPYILGFHLIYVLGSIIFAWAIAPLVKNRFILLCAYLFVLYNPIAFATDITRYYRDILYYALCMVFISATVGLLIRQKGKIAASIAGFSLAWCILCREDGHWLYVYIIACFLAVLIFRTISDKKLYKSFFKEIICAATSFLIVVLCICSINYKYYGTFVLDEYNSGSYADAYGAISRLHGEEGNTTVVIPYSERVKLYEYSPAFAKLEYLLDGEDSVYQGWKIENGEYRSGYFSFNLRNIISDRGYYKDAKSTNRYLDQLAAEVNEYCDTVSDNAYHKRSTITSRFYPQHIPSIINSTIKGIKLTLAYTNVSCIPIPCNEDDKYLKIYEEFTNSTVAGNRYMETGEIIENYHLTGFARWMQRIMRVLIIIYSLFNPLLFGISVLYLIYQTVIIFKKYSETAYLKWISGSSLLALFLVRCLMIGFVDATTFTAINNPAYQAGSYVAMGCFIAIQLTAIVSDILDKKKTV